MADFRVIGNDLWRQHRAHRRTHYIIHRYILYSRFYFRIAVQGQFYNIILYYIIPTVSYIIIIYYDIIMWKNIEIRSIIDYFPLFLVPANNRLLEYKIKIFLTRLLYKIFEHLFVNIL